MLRPNTINKPNPPTRLERVERALLEHPEGISGREIDFKYSLNSGRNEVNDLINHHGINITKESAMNGFGNGYYTIYRVANKAEAYKVLTLMNAERIKRGVPALTENESRSYLSQFKWDL